jgi:hemoglobin-like flavoprotein
MAAYSHFARRCRVIPDTSAACSALRACVLPRCGWLRVKLVAPTSQAAALFYGQLFEIAPAVKSLLRGDMTEQGCKLMATLGVVVNSLGNLEAVLPAASALAKRHVDYGVKAADYTPVGVALLWTLEQGLGLR